MLNGDGLRVVLWVAGCDHYCKECQNPVTWNPNDGVRFDGAAMNEIIEKLEKPYISGLTLSGGDPLYKGNRDEVLRIAKHIKELFPNKTIWLYTGYLWEDVCNLEIIQYLDVLVDGEFKIGLKDNNYHWAGSRNQRVIDVKKTLEKGYICKLEE